ncbi:hypothetical protein PBY51_011143 [Eleginops maclovinus]|uniref:Ig-like domain-containing protein n=1 Tax=Eleginops maclovinus TaxID=56733 RepID=A0AAN7XCA1_ELEMC|nr:hypothetical protein PBY51_011143 [Eleginops maclovinus]
MMPGFSCFTLCMLWAADVSQSVLITQWPPYISRLPNGSAEMHCYQNETNYDYVYWYRQQRGKGFQFMVSVVAGLATFQQGFKSGYQAVKGKQQSSLRIGNVQEEDEAVYLCAASQHSAAANLRPRQKLTATGEAYIQELTHTVEGESVGLGDISIYF